MHTIPLRCMLDKKRCVEQSIYFQIIFKQRLNTIQMNVKTWYQTDLTVSIYIYRESSVYLYLLS